MRYLLLMACLTVCLMPTVGRAQINGDPGSLVDYWYNKYLGRPGDPTMGTWVASLARGTPPDQVLAGIIASADYYRRAGSTPQGFITLLYSDVLGQRPSGSELNYWIRRMYVEDRAALIMAFLQQNPGVWVGSSPPVSTPVLINPQNNWRREWKHDWEKRNNIYEYRRPYLPYYRGG
ncbi:hypothetical protein BH10PLA2_BH10PLA2_39080 [soil metagenome]